MTTIIAKLSKGHWVATENDVETLAHERYANAVVVAGADSTYLRVVLVAAQAKLGRARGRTAPRVNTEGQLTVLAEVHERFYAAVLRGVTTPEIAIEPELDSKEQRARSLERNSRSAFARSAASTLTAYVKAGGDLRALDAATVSKAALRAAMAPPEPEDRVARQIQRARGSLLRAITRRARDNPEEARTEVENLMDELQKVLDALDGNEQEEPEAGATTVVGSRPRDTGPARTRVGIPQLHRGAVS
jgi:hypothetical protein